jgi:Uncharacterized protein conserved in bacteria
MKDVLSKPEARRIAVKAAGLQAQRLGGSPRRIAGTLRRLGAVQIDSVNVFARSHYMPLFTRLGNYEMSDLDRLAFGGDSGFTEYWPHCAGIIPLENRPLFAFRMREFEQSIAKEDSWYYSHPEVIRWVKDQLRARGPLTAGDLEEKPRTRGPWWDWSDSKRALESLFYIGEAVVTRRENFRRVYALTEQSIPAHAQRAVPKDEAFRELMRIAVKNHGIGTLSHLADFFRLKASDAKAPLRELVEDGEVIEVSIEGVPAFIDAKAVLPRKTNNVALLSPFDPLIWHRGRTLSLFDFEYRIEIYTPKHKREYGYYSLPVLVDDRVPIRVDLKADRKRGVLMVQSAWWHSDAIPGQDGVRVAEELRLAATWQRLSEISVGTWGDAADALASELHAVRHDRF